MEPVSRHPLSWLRKLLRGETSTSDEPAEPEVERRSSRLFECEDCETTFIGVDKRSCSQCGGSVQEIPNERDLGRARGDDRTESPPPCER